MQISPCLASLLVYVSTTRTGAESSDNLPFESEIVELDRFMSIAVCHPIAIVLPYSHHGGCSPRMKSILMGCAWTRLPRVKGSLLVLFIFRQHGMLEDMSVFVLVGVDAAQDKSRNKPRVTHWPDSTRQSPPRRHDDHLFLSPSAMHSRLSLASDSVLWLEVPSE